MEAKKERVSALLIPSLKLTNNLYSKRDLILEFKINQWIEGIIHEKKPIKISFEEWISDGTVLSK